jgi:diguanylate cyclase (GGDEF)-like protein/PAS domain S-box-containing protein
VRSSRQRRVDPAAFADALEQLRTAGSHPIVKGFPEGAIIVFDRTFRYLCAGGRGLSTFGLTQDMIENRTIHEVFPLDVAAILEECYAETLAGNEVSIEIPFGDRTFLHRVSPLTDPSGTVLAGIGFALEVSAARIAEQALRDSEENLREQRRRLHDAEAIGHSGSWEWDAVTDVITWSDGLFAMHDLDPTEFPGGYVQAASRVHPEDMQIVDAAMEACRQGEETVRFRYRVARAGDGAQRWFDSHARGVFHDGVLVRRVGAVADITEIVLAQDQLSHDALHDSLTGLPNRVLLLDRLDAALARSHRYSREIAVLFCDLDGFKKVNDTTGHAAGDAVLVETARRLRQVVREGDTVARVGGDEFVVIVEPWNRSGGWDTLASSSGSPSNDRLMSLSVADRVVTALHGPMELEGIDHEITVSVGMTYPSVMSLGGRTDITAAGILAEADTAMYRAKKLGKDRFEVFADGHGRAAAPLPVA